MSTKLYVGNLAFSTTENTLREVFAAHGTVTDVYLALDKFSGRSRGFAFVTMGSAEEAQAAIQGVHGQNVEGRELKVNEARPKEASGGGRSFGGGGGGFGGGGGGGGGGRGGRDRDRGGDRRGGGFGQRY